MSLLQFKSKNLGLLLFVSLATISVIFVHCNCNNTDDEVNFNRDKSGVVFTGYGKRPEYNSGNGEEKGPHWWECYSLEEMETMLTVISTRFSKVTTYFVGEYYGSYLGWVLGRYHQSNPHSNPHVWVTEGAANINLKRGNLTLSILVGIWLSHLSSQNETEFKVALKSVKKANDIFSGTVVGLVLSQDSYLRNYHFNDLSHLIQTVEQIREFELENPQHKKLKIGLRVNCGERFWWDATSSTFRQDIFLHLDFIVCTEYPATTDEDFFPPEEEFDRIKSQFEKYEQHFTKINPLIEVMGETGWPTTNEKPKESVKNMKKLWQLADEWASKQNFTLWLNEAFDSPWKGKEYWQLRHDGWWKLLENRKTHYIDGYKEKIFETEEELIHDYDEIREMIDKSPEIKGSSGSHFILLFLWILIGFGIATIVLLCLGICAAPIFIYFRRNSLETQTTANKVFHGSLEDSVPLAEF